MNYYARPHVPWTTKTKQSVHDALTKRRLGTILRRHISRADTPPPPDCQYPIRDATKEELRRGDESWKCMHATKPGSSYCQDHHFICYVVTKKPVDDEGTP